MPEDLTKKTLLSISCAAVGNILTFFASAAASIILARNLSPSDYGIVGFATIFIGFLIAFSDLGISSAVVQKDKLDMAGLYTGFTIELIVGICIFVLVFVLSPLAKLSFDNDAVVVVIRILSVIFLLRPLAFLPTSLLTRELNYGRLSLSSVCASVLSSIVSVVLVLVGYKFWSIVIGNLCSVLTNLLIINFLKPVSICLCLNKRLASELIHFGGSVFLIGLLVCALFNMDNFIIGTIKGARELGYYGIAFSWGSMICGVLYSIIHSVLFRTFSIIQRDKERLKRNYLHVLEYVAFISVMVNVTLILVGQGFLFSILGHGTDEWLPALTAFRILCVYGILRAFLEPVANVLFALNKPNILVKSNTVAGTLQLGFLYPAIIYFGIEGAAVVVTLSYAFQYVICFPFLKNELNINYSEVWVIIRPTIICACIVMTFAFPYSKLFRTYSVLSLCQEVFLCFLCFGILHGIMTKWRLLKEVKVIIIGMKLRKKDDF